MDLNFIDKIFVINLDRRTDRLSKISDALKRLDLPYERFKAIEGGIKGCAMSHYGVIELAKNRGYKNILVLEDDAIFVEDFFDKLNKHIIPVNWNMIYLGSSNILKFKNEGEGGIVRIRSCSSAHAIIINESIYDALLAVNDFNGHLDDIYSRIMEDNWVYTLDPALVIQGHDYSDIANIKYDASKYFRI